MSHSISKSLLLLCDALVSKSAARHFPLGGLVLLSVMSCARNLPTEPSTAHAYQDFERLVALEQATGWENDSDKVDGLVPEALGTLCRTSAPYREQLGVWLASEKNRLGGEPKELFEQGRTFDSLKENLLIHRMQLLYDHSMKRMDECPFWIRPRDPFAGRQILDDHWVFSFGGGGKGIFVAQNGVTDINGGGAGRFLIGRAHGPSWMWMVGLEIGASASFARDTEGDRSTLVFGVDVVSPLVLRYRLVNSYFEVEAGYLAQRLEGEELASGIHVGVGIGANSARKRWVLPGAALGLSYERTFGEIPAHFLKIGFRVAIDVPFGASK